METFEGLLVLDKPGGITSRDAVDRAQRWFPRRTRIGHTGTLDPLASGVLVLCLGGATRLVEYVQDMSKVYHSVFRLGATSDSDDAEGVVTPTEGATLPGHDAVAAALAGFVGTIEQVPPAYSAARVGGQRAYVKARRGEEVTLAPRRVTIYGIDIRRLAGSELEVEVRCGKGTYIRSLARAVGAVLGCGAYVETLRRTSVGPFRAEDALPLDADYAAARRALRPAAEALSALPRLVLPPREVEALRHGQRVSSTIDVPSELVALFDQTGAAVAVVGFDAATKVLRPVKVLS